jgi:hypothetical protein
MISLTLRIGFRLLILVTDSVIPADFLQRNDNVDFLKSRWVFCREIRREIRPVKQTSKHTP